MVHPYRMIRRKRYGTNFTLAHFQQEALASFFIHNIGAFHDFVHFERLLAERVQDIFSIIQHD